LAFANRKFKKDINVDASALDDSAMSRTGGDPDGELALDCGDRNRRRLAGSLAHQGTNLNKDVIVVATKNTHP
jgi:hypothetical protein